MELPLLKVLHDGMGRELTTCRGQDYCAECSLHVTKGGRCEGCTSRKKATLNENFAACYQECSTCAGFKVQVPAICCRSPMKKLFLDAVTRNPDDWNNPKLSFHARPPIVLKKQRAIFYVTTGGMNTIDDGGEPFLAGHELVAANLSYVWTGRGFHKQDLKRYVRVPAATKLLMLTMTKDDLLETAWQRYFYADSAEYEKAQIDYWMPLSFSSYPTEAHMHQIYQLYRTLLCTEQSRAWFTTGDHFQEGLRIDDLFRKCVEKIRNVVFNTQFVNDSTYKFHLRLLQHAHEISPADTPFWLVGRTDPTFMHNVRRVCGGGSRTLYWVSSQPLVCATMGSRLLPTGKSRPSTLPKADLVRQNYAVFERMVNDYGR